MRAPRGYGRRFEWPVDPWPRASLGERLSVALVLGVLLLLPFCAAGVLLAVLVALSIHVSRSFGAGAALRALLDRHAARRRDRPPARHLRQTA